MSRTLDQIYIANPITTNASTDLMYFSQSPYTSGHDAGMNFSNFAAQFATPTQIQQSAFSFHAATGVNDAFIVNLSPAATSYTDGLIVAMDAATLHNLTTTPTLAVNALTAKSIVTYWGNLAVGDISAHGTYLFIYNATSDNFELINPTISTANTTFVQYNTYNTATDAGIANAYIGTLVPPITLLLNSLQVNLVIAHTNTTASTLNVNGTPTAIVLSNNAALTGGELVPGQNAMFIYSGTYNKFILLNPANGVSGAGNWVDQASNSVTMTINTGYTTDNGASLVTYTLPASAILGSWIEINGLSSGGWSIAQAAGQLIHDGNQVTTTGVGGSLSSTNQYDCVRLRCVVANTTWTVVSQQTAGLTFV